MRITTTKFLGLLLVCILGFSSTACSSNKTDGTNHKPATAGCLIKSTKSTPGSPERQLAADLVQAQVVFGIRVRDVEIAAGEEIMPSLLTALQSGCVFMASGDTRFLDSLASFAKLHPKMMVFFVGGTIAAVDQPSNFRWLADDMSSGAALAGFAAAESGNKVLLFIQDGYYQSSTVEAGFRKGVRDYSSISGDRVSLSVSYVSSDKALAKKLQGVVEPSVVSIFAAKSIWAGISDYSNLTVIGADLQFGNTRAKFDPALVASVERNSGTLLLRSVSGLLARKFNSSPPFRKPLALKSGLIGLVGLEPASAELENYRQSLIDSNR